MKLNITSAKLIPLPSQGFRCQIFEFNPTEVDTQTSLGRLTLMILDYKNQDSTHWRDLFEKVKQDFLSYLDTSPLEAIKKSLEPLKSYPELDYAFTVLMGDAIYFALKGEVEAYVLRQGSLVHLLSGEEQTTFISGKCVSGDTYLVANAKFVKSQGQGVLKAALTQSDLQSSAEMLAPTLAKSIDACALIEKVQTPDEKSYPVNSERGPRISLGRQRGLKIFLLAVIDYLLKILPTKRLYVQSADLVFKAQRSNKRAAFIGIILLLVLGLSVGLGVKRSREQNIKNQYLDELTQARHQFEEAKTILGLNQARARSLILDAKRRVDLLVEQGVNDPELSSLKADIDSQVGNIAGIYQQDAQMYLDLSLISSGMRGTKLVATEGRMLLLDESSDRLVSISIENKRTEVLARPTDLSSAYDVAAYVNKSYVLASDGVVEVADPLRTVIKKDWSDNTKIHAFAANMYLLDNERKEIYRFGGNGTSFGSKAVWLPADSYPKENVISWAIDGSIWVLTENGNIFKFVSGHPDSFHLQGASDTNFDDFYTDETLSDLYFLDKQNSRILVFDKKGVQRIEYDSEILGSAVDFIVSNNDKKIIILADSKLSFLDLKHF